MTETITPNKFIDVFSKRLSKAKIDDVVCIASAYKLPFDKTVEAIIEGSRHEAFMAAWTMQYAGVNRPEWFYEHLENLIKSLEKKPNEAVLRSVVRVIWKTPIPREMDGLVTHKCIEWLEDKERSIAVRAFSMHVLSKIIEHEPGLCNELRDITESILPNATSGLANAAQKLLKKISMLGY